MAAITQLFDHDDPPSDSTRVVDRIPQATLDSIFAVLGQPENQVRLDEEMPLHRMGLFDTGTRQLTLNPRQDNEEMAVTLAHEMAHQASTGSRFKDPELFSIYDQFISHFTEAPIRERRELLTREYPGEQVDRGFINQVTEGARSSAQINELFASAFGEAFDAIRRGEAEEFAGDFPVGREIVNLFMNRFPKEEP